MSARRAALGVAAGVAMMVCAREAAAQTATFGLGFGGVATAFMRTTELDARLAAAGRASVGGPAGGFSVPLDGSIGPVRLALSIDAAFPADHATRSAYAFSGAFLLGARIRRDGWVLLPALGPSYSSLSLCVKGPAGAVPAAGRPLFDQILSAAGRGECLLGDTTGMRFEIGLDREFRFPSTDIVSPSFFLGARAGVTLPISGGWRWGTSDIAGPTTPLVTPYLGLVFGFRIQSGD